MVSGVRDVILGWTACRSRIDVRMISIVLSRLPRLKNVFASVNKATDYAWITIDMTRITYVKNALKKAKGNVD